MIFNVVLILLFKFVCCFKIFYNICFVIPLNIFISISISVTIVLAKYLKLTYIDFWSFVSLFHVIFKLNKWNIAQSSVHEQIYKEITYLARFQFRFYILSKANSWSTESVKLLISIVFYRNLTIKLINIKHNKLQSNLKMSVQTDNALKYFVVLHMFWQASHHLWWHCSTKFFFIISHFQLHSVGWVLREACIDLYIVTLKTYKLNLIIKNKCELSFTKLSLK